MASYFLEIGRLRAALVAIGLIGLTTVALQSSRANAVIDLALADGIGKLSKLCCDDHSFGASEL